MSDAPALSRTGVRGLGFQVRNTGKHKEKYRLYATAQWSEGGVQQQKIRSISIRGIPRAARRIAKVLVSCHPSHEDKNVKEMTETCWKALEELIMRIHREDSIRRTRAWIRRDAYRPSMTSWKPPHFSPLNEVPMCSATLSRSRTTGFMLW